MQMILGPCFFLRFFLQKFVEFLELANSVLATGEIAPNRQVYHQGPSPDSGSLILGRHGDSGITARKSRQLAALRRIFSDGMSRG
jgi:hypothetical protein